MAFLADSTEISFKRLFEGSPAPYLVLNPQLKIVAASDQYLNVTMTSREEILGKLIFDVFPDNPNDPSASGVANLRASLEHVLEFKETHKMPTQRYDIRMPESEVFQERFWSPTNFAVLNEDGDVQLLIHHAEDITDLVRLRKAEAEAALAKQELRKETQEREHVQAELDQFFSVSLDMLCISNVDGYFKRVSPAFTSTLGWSVEDLLTRPFVDFVHPDDLEATIGEVKRQTETGETVLQFENRYLHKDGSWRVLSWKSVPQPNGYMYATARNVTELKISEQELIKAKKEAESASQAKSEFLSNMSHELRTPLNSVLGYAQLLDLQYGDPKIKEASRAILKSGNHLLAMINEFLDLARIESGTLALSVEQVPVAEVLSQAIGLVQPIADAREVSLKLDMDVCEHLHVVADRQRLIQIFVNLISNAIKFNRSKGAVLVNCQESSEGFHRVRITDTGPGISPENQKLLFTPFQRFGEEGVEGTGLGLALSQKYASMMGGRLGLLNSSPEGSTFYIDLLPGTAIYSEVVAPPTIIPAAQLLQRSEGSILYIEDNPSNTRLLEAVIADFDGINLIPAALGRLGLELARERRVDLILLDVHLPDLMGDEVLRRLREDPRTAAIPIVVLSADATGSRIRGLLDLGAVDYLTKPLDLDRLLEVLARLLPKKNR